MKRIRNVEVCLEGALTRHGTVVGPAMTSLVGYPELTPAKGGWCGNDIWRGCCRPDRRTPRERWCESWATASAARGTAATSRWTSCTTWIRASSTSAS